MSTVKNFTAIYLRLKQCDVDVKDVIDVKKIMFAILLHVIVKMEQLASIMDDSVFACDETIEKAVSTNSDEKKQSVKQKMSVFTSIFNYYYNIIDGFQNFLLPDIFLIDEKSYENILVYNISYKKLIV